MTSSWSEAPAISDTSWHTETGSHSILQIIRFSNVTWASWRFKSPTNRLFYQLFVQSEDKEKPHYWPFWGGSTGHRWILISKMLSEVPIPWKAIFIIKTRSRNTVIWSIILLTMYLRKWLVMLVDLAIEEWTTILELAQAYYKITVCWHYIRWLFWNVNQSSCELVHSTQSAHMVYHPLE